MEARDIEARLLSAYGLRIDPEMSGYVARRLRQAGKAMGELAVIGGEARTGAPQRIMIDPKTFQAPADPGQPAR
jgi:hypothetical protein